VPHRLLALLPLLFPLSAADGNDTDQIFSPPEGAVFKGAVRVIARTAGTSQLKLDGQKVDAQSPHQSVLTALVKPAEGAHELTLGDQKVRFSVGSAATFRAHAPVENCASCHMIRNGRWRFVRASLATVCSQCHDKEAFPARHTHQMDVLPDCQLCHDPHGSTAAAQLKMEKEKACKQCHSLQ
jgi:predicted CXXCH cytochrome family protein